MRIGINYPWFNYGWDFGPPVEGWGTRATWHREITNDLTVFQRCGITIVRWFILPDGITYGTGHAAPRRDGEQWRFDRTPSLEPTVLEDFRALLRHFSDANISLIPVLIDFKLAFPGLDHQTEDPETLELWDTSRERVQRIPAGFVKGGRFDVIYDERKRRQFFQRVLTPFLEASQQFPEVIYAWELINEPEWITQQRGLGGHLPDTRRIPLSRMIAFIQEGLEIITEHGFRPTVGFAKSRTLGDWQVRTAMHLRSLTHRSVDLDANSLGLGLNQIHYYPHDGDELVPAHFPNGRQSILGEFATRVRGISPSITKTCQGSVWPDLSTEQQGIAWRLRRAQSLGYEAALPWSYRSIDCPTEPNRSVIEAAFNTFYAE